jgi:hypothetical protein
VQDGGSGSMRLPAVRMSLSPSCTISLVSSLSRLLFPFFVLYFSLSRVNPIEDCQSLWSNEVGIKTVHFLGLAGILVRSEDRRIA